MDPIELPPPYYGVNELVPKIALESPFCETLLNFNVNELGASLRNGDSREYVIQATTTTNTILVMRLIPYGDSKLFALCQNNTLGKPIVIDVEANSVVFTAGSTYVAQNYRYFAFNNAIYLLSSDSYAPGIYYDGSSWATIGYTGSGFSPLAGCPFKRRAYIIQNNSAAYWYSGINKITGALTKVDLSGFVSRGAYLWTIAPLTLSDVVASETLLAFIFSSGEVLFFSGSYPDSDNWSLVAQANIGTPLGGEANVGYNGDQFIACDNGIVSLREVFLKGSASEVNNNVNRRIQKKWRSLIKAIRAASGIYPPTFLELVRPVLDPVNNRIIFSFPYRLSSDGNLLTENFQFIFDTIRKCWYYHQSQGQTSVTQMAAYKDGIYFCGSTASTAVPIFKKEGASGFGDENASQAEQAYDFDMISAPIRRGRDYVQQVQGMDLLLRSDLYDTIDIQMIRDFGVEETLAQKIPDQGTEFAKPFVNLGISGSFVQYRISGSTTSSKTVGLDLQGANIWTSIGNRPR